MDHSKLTIKQNLLQFFLVLIVGVAGNFFSLSLKEGTTLSGLEVIFLTIAFTEIIFSIYQNSDKKTLSEYLTPILFCFLGLRGRVLLDFVGTSSGLGFMGIYTMWLFFLLRNTAIKPKPVT